MASFGDEVAEFYRSGRPRAGLRELCRDWKRVRTPYSVTHAVSNAAEDNRGQHLYAIIMDEDFRALRRRVSGLDGLREDIRTSLDYFAGHSPNLLRYVQIRFLEPTADQELLTAHQQHIQGFDDFLQLDRLPHEHLQMGLHKVLDRFFPVEPQPLKRWRPSAGEQPVIDLDSYALGTWRCSCGALSGLATRYSFRCQCGALQGTGRLAPDRAVCTECGGYPSYVLCANCKTRVTLENIWKTREDSADPAAFLVPLTLHLSIRQPNGTLQRIRLPLMELPIPLGIQEREGSIVLGLPDVLWLNRFSSPSGAPRFVSLDDELLYDRQTDLRKIFESMFRRTLLKFPYESYRKFGGYITKRVREGQISAPDYSLTRTFQRLIMARLTPQGGPNQDMLRLADLSADAAVAASEELRGNVVLVSSRFAVSPLLTIPRLLNMHAVLPIDASFTARPPKVSPDRVALLDASGLARPGRAVQPGQALAGIARPSTRFDEPSSPEERLLQAIGLEHRPVRDASVYMPAGAAGRVLSQHINVGSTDPGTITPAPGRIVQVGGPNSITTTLAIDRPLEIGDTLLEAGADGSASAVVCGIRSAWELSRIADTGNEPDLVVSRDHPWAPSAGTGTRRLRVRLGRDEPDARDTMYSGHADSPPGYQPVWNPDSGNDAVVLTPREFRWLISRRARHLALELYGPRGDCGTWRRDFLESLTNGDAAAWPPPATPLAEWTSLSDSPSSAMREWERVLRSVRIRTRFSQGQVFFQFMNDAEVLELSHGEVTQLEGFRHNGPNPEGLFSQRIFGPLRSWECACGKRRGRFGDETTCEECGVEPTSREVRRDRMGHIELPAPVVHSWFQHDRPREQLADLLRVSTDELMQIIRFEAWVVVEPGATSLHRGQILSASDARKSGYVHRQTGGVRFAAGGEAIEILLRQANGPHKPHLDTDRVIMRRIPVLPPGLRIDIHSNLDYLYADLYSRYAAIIRNIAEDLARLARRGIFDFEFYVSWYARLQINVNSLFGCSRPTSLNRPSDPQRFSLADKLCGREKENARDHILSRYVDHGASAKLVTGDTGDIGTALLPVTMMQTLLRPAIARILAATGIADNAGDAWIRSGQQTSESRKALDVANDRALFLLSFPDGPCPLVAIHARPADDRAACVHPRLLDKVGWDNLGRTVNILSIHSAKAAQEAGSLLVPECLLASADSTTRAGPPGKSVFDIAREDLTESLIEAAWNGTSFKVAPEDFLLLGAADWISH